MVRYLIAVVFIVVCAAESFSAPTGGVTPNRPNTLLKAPKAPQKSNPAAAEASDDEGKEHSLNWDQAPSEIILQAYAAEVGKTVLIDPQTPKAQITLKSEEGRMLSREEYLEAIEVVLEMNQIHIEPYGDVFIKALPRKSVRNEGIPLIMDSSKQLPDKGQVVSMMIKFENISAKEEAKEALDNFKSPSGVLLAFERTNSILVTDTQQNINRMLEIARAIDVSTPVLENVFVRQIKYASAVDVKEFLEKIVEDSMKLIEKSGKGQATIATQQRPQSSYQNRLFSKPSAPQPAPVANVSKVMSVSDADRGMIRGNVLILADERSNKLVIKSQESNMKFFDRVIEQIDVETTPDTAVKVYRLKYAEAEDVSDMINDLIGNAPSSKSSSKGSQNANSRAGGTSGNLSTGSASRKSANQRSGEPKAGELNKENTTVLADKRINGLIVMTEKELVPTIEQIIESMDVKLSQVLIETVIIEVSLGDAIQTGIDWVRGMQRNADNRYQAALGGGGGSAAAVSKLTGTNSAATALIDGAATVLPSIFAPGASGLTYAMFSKKFDLAAVVSASKSDSNSKYIASPIIMTVDNKEATVEATETRKFFSGFDTAYNYTAMKTPKYDSKDIGITIKVTPKINPNGTVMLEVEEEYSQIREKAQEMFTDESHTTLADTAVTRKMSADVLLDNSQTVVLGGLSEKSVSESESGIPILKDIPWVGKWLFGSVSKVEGRKELLVFMTPYVLNDAEAAQAEALRRKNALSDRHAWDDSGWSASALADPISKKEQMRRLKEEWRKQDEERKTKLAIESAKLERVKKLEKMSQEEREFWIEQHKEELEKEQQEELEEKLLDEESQDELQKLAAEVRARMLKEANDAIKENDEADKKDNPTEHEKLQLEAKDSTGN